MSEERSIDGPRIERAVREVLLAIGEDPGREGLIGTPERVAEAYAGLFSPRQRPGQLPGDLLRSGQQRRGPAAGPAACEHVRASPASICGQGARRVRARGACRRTLGDRTPGRWLRS